MRIGLWCWILPLLLGLVWPAGRAWAGASAGKPEVSAAGVEGPPGARPGPGWRFAEGVGGFTAAHAVAPLTVAEGALQVRVTGFDPYIHSPRVELVGERDRYLRVRLRATRGSQVALYFVSEAGGWSEARRLAFDIVPGPQYRDYWVDLSAHPGWRGRIDQFRLDLEPPASEGALLEVAELQFYQVGPSLSWQGWRLSRASLRPGQPVELEAQLMNSGGEVLEGLAWSLRVPPGLAVQGARSQEGVRLPLSGALPLRWRLEAERPGLYTLELQATAPSLGTRRWRIPLAVLPAVVSEVAVGGQGAGPYAVVPARRGDEPAEAVAVLGDGLTRLVFPRSPFGYAEAWLEARRADAWLRLAVLPAPALTVQHGADREELLLVPTVAEVLGAQGPEQGAGLAFSGQVTDGAGTAWAFRVTYRLPAPRAAAGGLPGTGFGDVAGDNPVPAPAAGATPRQGLPPHTLVEVELEVRPDGPAQILRLAGPTVLVGEGSFGEDKEAALFPGLEWLVGEERSSSTLDAHPPHHLRVVPHPLKITIPFLAVQARGFVTTLMWDPQQAWGPGGEALPAARFASPNWLEGQANHLLGLFVPSVGTWVPENETLAEHPYTLTAGQALRLRAQVAVAAADDVLAAWELYAARYGWPTPSVPPRSWDEERSLLAHAYLSSYWKPEARGWGHVEGWSPEPFPGLTEALRLLADAEPDPTRREAMLARVKEAVAAAVVRHDPGWLGTSAGGHLRLRLLPFYQGFVVEALRQWQREVEGRLRAQTPQGLWAFRPADERQRALGPEGAAEVGLTAEPARDLLLYARITGDEAARAAGLRALAAMRAFRVPRAAQTWEVPVHAPDLLAAAHAVGAYVEGYRLTGDPAYLDDARYWARAGLPFVYAWGVADRLVMKGATIAVFGATHYVLPWFGRPVQWNGLVYAYHLLELAELDPGAPWAQVARSILVSALHQQRTQEPARGGYPDVWELIPNRPIVGVDINPEAIAKTAVFAFTGRNPGLQTAVASVGGRTVRVTAAVPLRMVQAIPGGLQWEMSYVDGAQTHLLVTGASKPQAVWVGDELLPEERWYQLKEQAWTYEDGYLVIKVRHQGATRVRVLWGESPP